MILCLTLIILVSGGRNRNVPTTTTQPKTPAPVTGLQNVTYPDMTKITGKHKEAYAYLLCTRPDAAPLFQLSYDALRGHIWRLLKLDSTRDIVVMVCEHTLNSQYEQLKEDGAIVIPVNTLKTKMKARLANWADVGTKLLYWKLTGWERVLCLDIDIYFKDKFIDIWDQPANQIVEKPPLEFVNRMDEEYNGVKLRDLFPYVFAACPDTYLGRGMDDPDSMNGGLFLITPSIAHFNLVLNVANNVSKTLTQMDQSVINDAYNRTGPLPWASLGPLYNTFPYRPWSGIGTNFTDEIKAYHIRFWGSELVNNHPIYRPMYNQWLAYNKTMYAEKQTKQILHPNDDLTGRVSVNSIPGGIMLKESKPYDASVTVYAIISQDLSNQPIPDQVKNGLDASNAQVPHTMAPGTDKGFNLIINNLSASTNYKIYYVKYDAKTDKFSPVGAVQVTTTASFLEERILNSASLISLSMLSFMALLFISL